MRDIAGRMLPPGHRAARVLIVVILAAAAGAATMSQPFQAAVGWAFDGVGRITTTIWAPLLDTGEE